MISRRRFLEAGADGFGSAAIPKPQLRILVVAPARDYWNDWPAFCTAMARQALARRKKPFQDSDTPVRIGGFTSQRPLDRGWCSGLLHRYNHRDVGAWEVVKIKGRD
jgi:hypothetical protein